jgi:hypothetical protein
MEKSNEQAETKPCTIHSLSGLAYFRKHKTPILIGFAIGTTFSIVLNLIENIVIKIAMILYGG